MSLDKNLNKKFEGTIFNNVELSTRNVVRETLNDEVKPIPLAKRVY